MRQATAEAASRKAERQLLDSLRRILRSPTHRRGWTLLVLHLSRLAPAGPRPHHRRVAAAVLDDVAARNDGQLFRLGDDLALLFRPNDGGAAIATLIARLFQADAPQPEALRSVWPLPDAAADAMTYLRDRPPVIDALRSSPGSKPAAVAVPDIDQFVQAVPLANLAHRRVAVLLRPSDPRPITPAFREITTSAAALTAHAAAYAEDADPFLHSQVAARLDQRLLATMLEDGPAAHLLTTHLPDAALHLNLTPPGILSDEFAGVAAACQDLIDGGLRLAIEIPFVEMFTNPHAFLLARERLRLARMHFVLDGLDHHALALSMLSTLQPHWIKLAWSPLMAATSLGLRDAIDRVGADRLVLTEAHTEAAIGWGIGHGIACFQGRYVDMMLAAERLDACPHAAGCTLRQCSDRASATTPAGRLGCANPALLDMAAPVPTHARAA